MHDDFQIAPTEVILRYLCLFRRWFGAAQRYARTHDQDGILLCAWIADALHNVPSMLWRYKPDKEWNGPVQLAAWMMQFPQLVRELGAPQQIADACDAIFASTDAEAELNLHNDLSDLDLAPPEKLSAYLDLIRCACLESRWRPGNENPWREKSASWQQRETQITTAMGEIADLLVDVPQALVHWRQFDDEGFAERARTLWRDWPWDYGLERLARYRDVERLRPLWHQSLPTTAEGYVAEAPLHWLVTQYAQPWRAYHTLQHIEHMFHVWQEVGQSVPVTDAQALGLAIWFHDAVYNPRRHDNEARSAEAARQQLPPLGIETESLERISPMILATATHQTDGQDGDTALLLDLDLAILGAEAEEYAAYAHAVREEYRFVAEPAYRAARTQVLGRFLKRPQIFLTEPMFARYEERARQNLAREVAVLEGMG